MSLEGIDMAAPTGEDEADFDREWVARMVGSVLEELQGERPAHHRALVLVLGGRSQPEIAAELGQSVAQVNNHVHRAKAWVRTRIRSLVRESCSIPEAYEAEMRHLDRYIDLDEREST